MPQGFRFPITLTSGAAEIYRQIMKAVRRTIGTSSAVRDGVLGQARADSQRSLIA